MSDAAEQGQSTPEPTHSPSDWAAKLRESSKAPPQEEKELATPQEEEVDTVALDSESAETDEAPTSDEDQDDAEGEEEGEESLDEEDDERAEAEPEQTSIAADGVYLVDGEEIDGQTLLNGIAATKNFAQEKHRLREESATALAAETEQLHSRRDEYAQATTFMLGMNRQAYQQVENQLAQTTDPQEFQRLRSQQGQMQQAAQQLQGQFDQFLTQVNGEQAEQQRKKASESLAILRDEYGDGWNAKYPKLRDTAKEYGFDNAEFNTLTDHRFMKVLGALEDANGKLAEMQSVAKKKTARTVKERNSRKSERVNTAINTKAGDALEKAKKSHKGKDFAAAWLDANTKKRGR